MKLTYSIKTELMPVHNMQNLQNKGIIKVDVNGNLKHVQAHSSMCYLFTFYKIIKQAVTPTHYTHFVLA